MWYSSISLHKIAIENCKMLWSSSIAVQQTETGS